MTQNAYARYAALAAPVMQEITFGIEIETKRMSRENAAKVIAAVLGGTVRHAGGYYDKWICKLADGREWTTMSDASIGSGAEIVSPICKGDADIEATQKIVRGLRDPREYAGLNINGAKVDSDCGIHVHIGCRGWSPKEITRLVKNVYSQEDLLIAALGCTRRVDGGSWCHRVSEDFMSRLPNRPSSDRSIGRAWYGSDRSMDYARSEHYHGSRYHGLNLHNLWFGHGNEPRGTVEFRYFAPTLHAGRVKTIIQLCLALGARARLAKGSVARRRVRTEWTKYDMRVYMIRLGMMGDTFKTARKFLMENLSGNSRSAGTGNARGGVRRTERNARDAA